MPSIVKSSIPDPPYSLHDAHILKMQAEGDILRLITSYGYVRTSEPFGQVEGDVEITGVDMESSYVYVMDYPHVLCGNCGEFTGRKMTLETFLEEYAGSTLTIMDESYGYRMAKLNGFLDAADRLLECVMDLYYSGEFRYLIKE